MMTTNKTTGEPPVDRVALRKTIQELIPETKAAKRSLFADLLTKKFADADGKEAAENWLKGFESDLEKYVNCRILKAIAYLQLARAEPI